jgi:hypothetical protein
LYVIICELKFDLLLVQDQLDLGDDRIDLELELMFVINDIFDLGAEFLQNLGENRNIESSGLSLLDNLRQLITLR